MKWLKKNWYILAIPLVALLIGGSAAVVSQSQQKTVVAPTVASETGTTPTTRKSKYEDEGVDANEVLELVNAERVRVGVAPLTMDLRLINSAQKKADDMAANNYFAHESPLTGKHGYEYAHEALPSCYGVGENIYGLDNTVFSDFRTDATSQKVFDTWKNSAPHYNAMIDKRYSFTGIATAVVDGNKKIYTVEHFCQP